MNHYRSTAHLTTLLVLLAALLSLPFTASAAAPFHPRQVPGYFRMALGNCEVTALFDGNAWLDDEVLKADRQQVESLLARDFSALNRYKGGVTAFLVNTGDKLVLIDAGDGGKWYGPSLGKMLGNLRAAGYRPEQVDQVLITHAHPDHLAGITDKKGRRVFPNAEIRLTRADSDHWLSKDNAAAAPNAVVRNFFTLAQDAARPYLAAKKWRPFDGTAELVPGIRPYPLPGHTAGHTGYEISSQGRRLLIWGDVVHVMPVQLPRPDIAVAFDSDSPAAIAQRQALFETLASNELLIGGQHMPFPSLGRLRKDGTAFVWVPINFTDGALRD